ELVARLGRANDVVVGDRKLLPRTLELRRQLVDERLRRLARVGRGFRDFLAVLVGARQEVRGVPALAMESRERVREHLFIGVTQVGSAVDVVDGGGDVEASWHKV